jgi:trigger factor
MQTKQTVNEGLKRSYAVTIAAGEITARVDAELKKIAPQVRMPGFRPGKVPVNLLKKMHGESVHAQVVNDTIRESLDKLIRDEQLRPAMQPAVELGEGYEQGKDAELTISLEVLPVIDAPNTDGITIERLVVPVTDEQIDEALTGIAGNNKSYKDAAKSKKAANGDQIIIDFVGKLGDEPFEGGSAEDTALVLGSNTFIPGFEEQLVGVKTGEEKTITVTFPADYQAEHLAGKDATFEVTVKAVKVETDTKIDEEFAKNLGLDSLEKLKEIMKAQLEQQTAGLTRTQMKRQLLDQLAAGHSFAVPPSMVEAEFEQIWTQLQQEASQDEDPEAAMKQIEAEKDEYRTIAERRVRLGLLLSEIGQANGVEVTGQEMGMLVQQAAAQYRPEDRQRFVEYIQSEPMAAAQLRAPLYEDKVVDFLFDKATITEREVALEELQAAIEAEDGAEVAPAPKKAPAKKKASPKKSEAAAEDATADAAPAEDKPAKKAPAKKADDAAAEEKPTAKKAPAKKAAAKK